MGGYRFFRFFDDNLSNHPCTIKNECPLNMDDRVVFGYLENEQK